MGGSGYLWVHFWYPTHSFEPPVTRFGNPFNSLARSNSPKFLFFSGFTGLGRVDDLCPPLIVGVPNIKKISPLPRESHKQRKVNIPNKVDEDSSLSTCWLLSTSFKGHTYIRFSLIFLKLIFYHPFYLFQNSHPPILFIYL